MLTLTQLLCRTLPHGHSARRRENTYASSENEELDYDGKRLAGHEEEEDGEGDDDDEEEEVYEAEDDETVAEIAKRLGCDAHEMLRLNKGRYTGLTLNSRLFAGTLLLYPQEEGQGWMEEDEDQDGGGKIQKPQVGRRRKGLLTGGPRPSPQGSAGGKRKREEEAGSDRCLWRETWCQKHKASLLTFT